MVSSRWVAGLSIGIRAFSANKTIVKATPAKRRLGSMTYERAIDASTTLGRAVLPDNRNALNNTMSSAGSARKPTIISRRAPIEPKAVPISMAASDRNTRAVANSPINAIASATRASGRSVATEGMMAAANTIVPKRMYGVARNRGEAFVARATSF
jgi:hypothetical protein